ncbi:MAG TPA: hypothetical protein VJ652_16455 [Noviherbaspirillum sp.]|nr:hypothetical protein [Noviherbaspirillum sp.]
MSKINNGGHAFPRHDGYASHQTEGMTLRDYFAAKAVAALIAEPPFEGSSTLAHTWAKTVEGPEKYAEAAYRLADAMLAEREKGAKS